MFATKCLLTIFRWWDNWFYKFQVNSLFQIKKAGNAFEELQYYQMKYEESGTERTTFYKSWKKKFKKTVITSFWKGAKLSTITRMICLLISKDVIELLFNWLIRFFLNNPTLSTKSSHIQGLTKINIFNISI